MADGGGLDEQVAAVRQDASLGSVERAKGVGSLAGIALRAIDAGDVAARDGSPVETA